ncbi:37426_t:CDS:2, partial [Gigaspora margarita]
SEIHYGAFSHEWWITIEKDSNNQATMLFPIRIDMKILVELNSHEFFINILEPNIEDSPIYSEIYTSSSAAITSLYQQLFGTKTKFSGPLVMGFDQLDIVKQLIEDINFQPFEFYLENKIKTIINGTTPTDTWLKIDRKSEFDANELFGISNLHVRKLISKLRMASCASDEWNNEILLEQIFRYHLKKRTKSDINWIEFIYNWKNQVKSLN